MLREPAMNAQTLPRANNFNLLRLVFASLVLLSHAPELIYGDRSRELLTIAFNTISFGELAVDGFFLLSGYLIVQSWINRPDALNFLKKRLLRIYPGLIVATLVCVVLVGPLAADPKQYFSHFWITGFFKNLFLLQPPEPAPVFRGTFYAGLNNAMWTIGYEFKCYLIVLLFGSCGAFKHRRLWLAVTGCIFLALLLEKAGIFTLTSPIVRLASFFFSGGLFYLYRDEIQFKPMLEVLAGIALGINMFSLSGAEIALATCGAYLLFYLAITPVRALQSFNWLPDVSYGVYLYGWPAQKLLLWYFPSMSPWVLFPASLSVCLLLGLVSWELVEKPMMRFKTKLRITPPVPSELKATLT